MQKNTCYICNSQLYLKNFEISKILGKCEKWYCKKCNEVIYKRINKNVELKTYKDWVNILEMETDTKIINDDGKRLLAKENKLNTLLSKEEAFNYFCINTIMNN